MIVSDAGVYAMKDIHQIYCYDPSMNVVEINQRVDNKHVDIEQDHPIRIEPVIGIFTMLIGKCMICPQRLHSMKT